MPRYEIDTSLERVICWAHSVMEDRMDGEATLLQVLEEIARRHHFSTVERAVAKTFLLLLKEIPAPDESCPEDLPGGRTT